MYISQVVFGPSVESLNIAHMPARRSGIVMPVGNVRTELVRLSGSQHNQCVDYTGYPSDYRYE